MRINDLFFNNPNILRDITITKKVLAGATYKDVAEEYSMTVAVASNIVRNMIRNLGSNIPQDLLKLMFPRSDYPEGYPRPIVGRMEIKPIHDKITLGNIDIRNLRDKEIFLTNQLTIASMAVEKEMAKRKRVEENRTYLSNRGIPLLYVGKPCDIPIVTLENYTKWYEVYLVMPDGSVQVAEGTLALLDKFEDAHWVDHHYHPRFLYRLAQVLNGTVDERAVEVAAGRWMIERLQDDAYKFHDPELD